MSHEWNCRCRRCLADEAKYDGPDWRAEELEDRDQMEYTPLLATVKVGRTI